MLHFYRFYLPACQMSPFLIRLAPLGTFPPGEGRALPRQWNKARRICFYLRRECTIGPHSGQTI